MVPLIAYSQVQYYVFLLFKGLPSKQVTRIVHNVEVVIMSVCFSKVVALDKSKNGTVNLAARHLRHQKIHNIGLLKFITFIKQFVSKQQSRVVSRGQPSLQRIIGHPNVSHMKIAMRFLAQPAM